MVSELASSTVSKGSKTRPVLLCRTEVPVIVPELTRVVRGLEVSASEREEVTHDFESGTLKVGASNPSGLLDALVYVKPLEGGPAIAQGRTYTSEANNPKAFELATGRYLVEVKQVKGPNQESFEVEVKKGTTTERMLQW